MQSASAASGSPLMRSTAGTPPGSGLVARQGSVVALPGSFVAAPVVRVAAAPQTPRVQQAPQAYRVVRSQSLVQPQPSQALTKLVDLLENENNIEKVMLAHYRKYASDRGMMRPEGARSFLMSLAMSLGFSNPQQILGDVEQMFWRFDFSGDGELDELEAFQLVKFVLRRARDRMMPSNAMRVGQLPRKDLQKEFELLKKLGAGGQGAVYLAKEKTRSGPERVVKFFTKAGAQLALEDLKEEVNILRCLDHPAIARVLDIFEDPQNVYLVAEPYFGGDLTDLMNKAAKHNVQPTHEWLGKIFRQILEGVVYIHDHRIMHCDLKESNVMIANGSDWAAPHVVIIDFDMAKDYSGRRKGGTPGYMPPEVWQSDLWTPKGDVFALGILFWAVYNRKEGGPFNVPDAPPYARIQLMTLQSHIDASMLPAGLRETTLEMTRKDFKLRPTADKVLKTPYFQQLPAQLPLDPELVKAVDQMGEKKQIQNLLAHELISKENLGQLHNLNSLFQSLDKDNSGTVEVQEAREVLEKAGLNQDQIGKFLSGLLGDKGSVHYTEFMAKLVMAQRGVREEEIGAAFASIDLDGSGTLDVNEVEKLLQQPDAARLLEGRAAKDVIEEMDRNADGVVDFKEFRRAMLGDPNTVMFWKKGDAARYLSSSFERWIPCRVEDVDQDKDSVIIDLKPGVWLTPEDMKHRLVPGNTCWSVGTKCQYYSRQDGFFLDATVMELDDKGNVIVDKRPGQWLPPWAIWEPADEKSPTQKASPQLGRGKTGLPPCVGQWKEGQAAMYYSKRQGAWFDCRVVAVDPDTGALRMDVKPEYWMPVEEQEEVLKAR